MWADTELTISKSTCGIDLFTDTAAGVFWDAQVTLAQHLRALFEQKEDIDVYFSASGDHYYIQTRHYDLFSYYNLYLQKLKEKLAQKARINTDASISDRAHAPWVSHNTPQIQLIQYGRRIGKKVYWFSLPINVFHGNSSNVR